MSCQCFAVRALLKPKDMERTKNKASMAEATSGQP